MAEISWQMYEPQEYMSAKSRCSLTALYRQNLEIVYAFTNTYTNESKDR